MTPWPAVGRAERLRYAMHRLVEVYRYPANAAAAITGNLWAESEVLPSRVEGSAAETPLRAPDFTGALRTFTAEEVMARDPASGRGPRRPGVGLAQWTRADRREGLFRHRYEGRRLGAGILFDMDAQLDYLVSELGARFRPVERLLRQPAVALDHATDEVVYNFQIPAAVVGPPDAAGRRRRLDREHAAVIEVCAHRRAFAREAIRAAGGA